MTGGRCVVRQAEHQHGEDRPDGAQRDHTEAVVLRRCLPGLTQWTQGQAPRAMMNGTVIGPVVTPPESKATARNSFGTKNASVNTTA